MTCDRCGSKNSYQFEATPSERSRPGPDELPLVCRDCGLITIGGTAVNLPEKLEQAARGMANAEVEEVAIATEEVNEITEAVWVERYMGKFFKTAYLEGFFRAIAFFRHNVKEGRLLRLRELWEKSELTGSKASRDENGYGTYDRVCIEMPEAAYTEFATLLSLTSVPGDIDAQSTQIEQET